MSAAEYRRQFTSTDGFDTCVCGVVCALSRKFSPFSVSESYYIVLYRRKNTFSCRRCQLLCCYSALLLWLLYLHATRVPGISVCIFSCNCTVLGALLQNCNFDAKQSTLCCFDGFRTFYCCVNADVSFRNYYHLNLSRVFSKASITVTLLRFG